MNTSAHDEALHPRNQIKKDGKFAPTTQTAPAQALPVSPVSDAVLDTMTDQELGSLYNTSVVDQLGLVGPAIDRTEAAYRLIQEPGFYDLDTDRLNEVYAAAGGTDKAFLDRVTNTDAWGELDEWTDEMSDRVVQTFIAALEEIDEGEDDVDLPAPVSRQEEADLSELRRNLVSRLGIVGPQSDRADVRYRLEEGADFSGYDVALRDKLVARFGSTEAVVHRVVNSDAWAGFSEWTDDRSNQVKNAIENVITELEAE